MSTLVHEPGSVRACHYHRGRDADGKYPVTLWGTVEEQIAEATSANTHQLSGAPHRPMELFTFTDDCPHSNPEDDDTYESVDDFVDDWMLRNCSIEPGWPSYPRECRESAEYAAYSVQNALYWRNRERAIAVIPLVYEYYRRLQDFEDDHSGNVCLKSPQGSVCRGCLEDDELDPDGDDGFEPGPCWRSSRAKERQSDFWHLFSEVAAKDRIPSDTSLETDQKAE